MQYDYNFYNKCYNSICELIILKWGFILVSKYRSVYFALNILCMFAYYLHSVLFTHSEGKTNQYLSSIT